MIKKGISFPAPDVEQQHKVVEVIDDAVKCEACNQEITLLESNNGIIACRSCGHENKTEDVESE